MPAKTAAIMPAVPVAAAPADIVAKKKSKAPNMTNVSTRYRFILLIISNYRRRTLDLCSTATVSGGE